MALTPETDDERVHTNRHEQEREAQAEQEHSPKPLDPPFSIILYKPKPDKAIDRLVYVPVPSPGCVEEDSHESSPDRNDDPPNHIL